MATPNNTHHLTVGDRAHRIVAMIMQNDPPSNRAQNAVALTRCGREVFSDHPVEYRTREAFLDAVTAAGVYINRFRPTPQWELIGDQVVDGGSRFDLVYRHENGRTLIDELKLGVGRADEAAVRNQVDRYLECGRRLWTSNFVGVRLCTVHEPFQSRLHLPEIQPRSVPLTAAEVADGLGVR